MLFHNAAADKLAAIDRSQAVIEFQPDGTIVTANENFLNAMGYGLEEIRGKHHSMFVAPEEKDGAAYRAFWDGLRAGKYQVAEYKRIGKGGKEVWIQASYNPIIDKRGRVYMVAKYATDVTAQKLMNADIQGQLAAIHKAQAVIEFNLDGTILTAKELPHTVGYRLDEIQGKHHQMFVDPDEVRSPPIANSGLPSAAANSRPPATSASARAARRSGSRPPTTRFST